MSRARPMATDLVELFDHCAAPIYLLDDNRRIAYCNPACARWVGTRQGALVGSRCAYHTPQEAGPQAAAAGLCPPPQVLSGQEREALVSAVRADGQLVFRRGRFLPLDDGDDESSSVLAVLELRDSPAPGEGAEAQSPPRDGELHDQVSRLRHEIAGRYRTDRLIGVSPQIVRARAQAALAAQASVPALCVGPPGSGKSHVGRSIHYAQREPGGLVPVDCGVLDPHLARSTLRSAWLRHARGGPVSTLLVEHVDAADGETQAELLAMCRTTPAPLRIIGTCDRLPAAGEEGSLRGDLVCAMGIITIELPPLTERLEDLPLLAQAFLEQVNATSTRQLAGFAPEALDQLATYPWQRNLDELAELVAAAHEQARSGEVTAADLPRQVRSAAESVLHPRREEQSIVLEELLARLEAELINRALARAKGNKSKAAKLLGLTRPRLYRRLVQLGLEREGSAGKSG